MTLSKRWLPVLCPERFKLPTNWFDARQSIKINFLFINGVKAGKWGQIYLFGGVKRYGEETSAVSQEELLSRLS